MEEKTTRRRLSRIGDGFRSLWNGHKKAIRITAISTLLLLIALVCDRMLATSLKDQCFATRWSEKGGYTQVTVLYADGSGPDSMSRLTFEHSLDTSFADDGIEEAKEGARRVVTAYSRTEKLSFSGNRSNVSLTTVIAGGDYFLFHPEQLLFGAYFSGNDVNEDSVVLDEDAAWQLFGAINVVGMTVTYQGQELIVTGVVKRECNLLEKEAGKDVATVYLSYGAYEHLFGSEQTPICYEILLPNPVSGYGKGLVAAGLGEDGENLSVIENTTRFSLVNRVKLLLAFPTRSMQINRIIPPSWENAARGAEDISTVLLLVEAILLIPLLVSFIRILAAIVRWGKKCIEEERKRNDWHSEEYGKARR